ncbi:hypothetical protein AVEN_97165-1 [Araneus ventricosus]|uniref:Uncharacterized protein n=1 Tax=Araneus ventricosus TaxID=182803 RepID=A0A4Y2DF33_ARAVE|nr:hypothetical protein AVEN_97165-1 [Araneus ventricosus]
MSMQLEFPSQPKPPGTPDGAARNGPAQHDSTSMQKEEPEEWMSIDEDIPVAATLTQLEICQAVGKQEQAIKVVDSEGGESVEENPPINAKMRQALDILKRSVQQNKFLKIRVRTIYK